MLLAALCPRFAILNSNCIKLGTIVCISCGFQGIFCPSLGAEFQPHSQSNIATLFPKCHVCFSQLRKVKKKNFFFFFFTFFRDHYYLWETMTHIRMILKHLCLSGMLGIIQSKMTLFGGYILLPLLFSMSLISPNFYVKAIIFSQFWPGTFSQNCWKKPWFCTSQGAFLSRKGYKFSCSFRKSFYWLDQVLWECLWRQKAYPSGPHCNGRKTWSVLVTFIHISLPWMTSLLLYIGMKMKLPPCN